MNRKIVLAIGLLLAQALPAQAQSPSEPAAQASAQSAAAARQFDAQQTEVLNAGVALVKQRRPAEAIEHYFDKVIASYQAMYPAGGKTVYCARSPTESLAYLLQATADKKEAIVIGPAWCDAYYLRAYGLIDLGRKAQARAALEQALAMSPKNAHYMTELAGLARGDKDWNGALAQYETAARTAREFAPPVSKTIELGEALRGKGYVLVELGRLDEAEATYKECLEINPADKAAMGELKYVQTRLQQRKPT